MMDIARTCLTLLAALTAMGPVLAQVAIGQGERPSPKALVEHAGTIVFLGDSITYSGQYVAYFDAWLQTEPLHPVPTVINVGLPSETVSGLSEAGHAGGKFPRPDLAERLDRVLDATKPDLIFACYGMNCGIYQPFDPQRFARYQAGIKNLRRKVIQVGADLVLITPPAYDDQRSKLDFSYNEVLDRYTAWLLSQRAEGWRVIDLHGAMNEELAKRRRMERDFTFQPDGVHPNEAGHWFIAQRLLSWLGEQDASRYPTATAYFAHRGMGPAILGDRMKRMQSVRRATLMATGHRRPGVPGG